MFKSSEGKPLGCATVVFEGPEDARRAIGRSKWMFLVCHDVLCQQEMLNNTELDGRIIEVRYDRHDS